MFHFSACGSRSVRVVYGCGLVMVVSGSVVMTVSVLSVDSTVVISFLHEVIMKIKAKNAVMNRLFLLFMC